MTIEPPWKPREVEIITLMSRGRDAKAIGASLGISVETVRWYTKQLYRRLNVSSRTEAIARARELGVLDSPVPVLQKPPTRSAIHFVANDGVYLAWQTIGEGPVDLLFIHGFLSHLELSWEDPEYLNFFEGLARYARVILFDKRGVGLSDRGYGVSTLEHSVSDARCVLDAAGSSRAFVMGTSESGASALLLASMVPTRVRGLILFGASPKIARASDQPEWAWPRAEFSKRMDLIQATWGEPWALEGFAPSRAASESFRAWWSRTMRAGSSPSAAREVMENAADIDVRRLLGDVLTRTLVVHRTGDRIVPVDAARYLADRLPNARLVELPGQDHVFFVDSDPLVRTVGAFLQAPDDQAEVETWIAVMLCMAGDINSPPAEVQAILVRSGVRAVHTSQRGWTAIFEGVTPAVRAAREIRALGRARVNGMCLHVGACRQPDGRPVGDTLEYAQRIAHAASPGEILVSGTLRDILAGSGLPVVVHSIIDDVIEHAPFAAWALGE